MAPLRPSSGIGPHETAIEEEVLDTAMTFAGDLLGTEISKYQISFYTELG